MVGLGELRVLGAFLGEFWVVEIGYVERFGMECFGRGGVFVWVLSGFWVKCWIKLFYKEC